MGKPSPQVPLHVIDEDGNESAQDAEGDIALQVDLSEQSNFFGVFDGYATDPLSLSVQQLMSILIPTPGI